MLQLPRGVTGFRHSLEQIPVTNLKAFRRALYAVARECDFDVSVENSDEADVCTFAVFQLESTSLQLSVIINKMHPLIALTDPIEDCYQQLHYVDNQQLAKAFATYPEFQLLPCETLLAPISEQSVANLGEAELAQFEYWQPKCLADVIFNNWD